MNYGKLLAWTLISINTSTVIAYFIQRDWRHGFYFLFAAAITTTVTV